MILSTPVWTLIPPGFRPRFQSGLEGSGSEASVQLAPFVFLVSVAGCV